MYAVNPKPYPNCSTKTVPFPLGLPLGRGPQRFRTGIQGVGQEKGVGPAEVGIVGLEGEKAVPKYRLGVPAPHEAVGDDGFIDPADSGERPNHELLRNPHAETAGDQLVPDQALDRVQRPPGGDHVFSLSIFRKLPQGQEMLLDPHLQRSVVVAAPPRKRKR